MCRCSPSWPSSSARAAWPRRRSRWPRTRPRALLAGIGLVGVTAALTLVRTGPDVSPLAPALHRRAPGGAPRRDGRRGGDGAGADDERARLHLDRGLRRVLLAAARGARLRGAHDRRARRRPAGRARPHRRVGLAHALRHGLGGGLRPHPAPRAPARRRPHRRPHRPAQPHRLRRRRRAPARDGRGAAASRSRSWSSTSTTSSSSTTATATRPATACSSSWPGVDRIAAPRRPDRALRRRRVRPADRGHERGPGRQGARAPGPLARGPVDVGLRHLLRGRVARRGDPARRRAPLRGEAPARYAEVPTATPGAPGISSGHTGSRSASALAIWRAITSRWISFAPS